MIDNDNIMAMTALEKEEEARCALKIWLHYICEDCKSLKDDRQDALGYTETKKRIRDIIEYIDNEL